MHKLILTLMIAVPCATYGQSPDNASANASATQTSDISSPATSAAPSPAAGAQSEGGHTTTRPRREPKGRYRTFTARAASSATVANEIRACTIVIALAYRDRSAQEDNVFNGLAAGSCFMV